MTATLTDTQQDRFWKSQPDDIAHECVTAVMDARSVNEVIKILADSLPDWTPSRCARYGRSIWNRRGENAVRSELYKLLPAANSDTPFRGREPSGHSDTVGRRAAHNADRR